MLADEGYERATVTTKDAFPEDEWIRIRRAPFVAGMAISLADPGGPFEMGRETMATVRSATNPPSREQLLSEIALDLQDMTQHKQNPLKDFKVAKGSAPGAQVLAELGAVSALVKAKASEEEYDAFRGWLVTTAEAAAAAAKEGGFMGFKAVVVSAGEQAMLEQLRSTLDLS
jgi:hypothetical protein